ncbi:hypothetical protein X777_03120 [Ooceraea biroi]|uniref:Uncharacterized protein n=1 Tax=Ooceraea biroi TaxID=2015173 RepID=A0A026WN18_OOCBI|nr:hypothetical protein X777_03120 [Ooceraea biroi]
MWQDLGGLGGVGVNSGAHQVDQFGTTGKGFVVSKPWHTQGLRESGESPRYRSHFSYVRTHASLPPRLCTYAHGVRDTRS